MMTILLKSLRHVGVSVHIFLAASVPALAIAQPCGRYLHPGHCFAKAGDEISPVDGRVFDLRLPDHTSQRVLYAAPNRPRAIVVMLPGGGGDVGMERDGTLRHDDNFVVRTRAQWLARGYAVLIPDAPGRVDLRGLRSSPQCGRLVDDLIGFARSQTPGPVFLLGTSQGSIAAMNGAAHASAGTLAGVVLTESVSRLGGSHETVFDADPQAVRVPALIVANRDDACDVAPPEDAPHIAAALTHARSVKVLVVAGGIDKSNKPCGSLTPHGYYGIEAMVIGAIDNWMRLQGG